MSDIQVLLNKNLQDINPILAGWAGTLPPGHINPPRLRNHALLHYVKKGKGILHTADSSFPVHAGQAFFIPFGEQQMSYEADMDDPWMFCWVGFTGTLMEEFSILPPVFDVEQALMPCLTTLDKTSDSLAYELAADLFRLYARLVNQEKEKQHYVQTVMEYIDSHYMQKISVENIANRLGLDRRYLSQQFKKKTGFTIQGYILNIRLQAAKQYLVQGLSVTEAATLSGFNDVSNFSKMFTREQGSSPKNFKKIVQTMLDKEQK